MNTLMLMIAARDKETATHSEAVAVWSRRIAEGMGLDAETAAFVELCGLLHDIGKVATPDSVLFKEGSLTNEEWATMKEHPGRGSDILNEIPALREFAPAVRGHHERFDGHGYPDRLCGRTDSACRTGRRRRRLLPRDGKQALLSQLDGAQGGAGDLARRRGNAVGSASVESMLCLFGAGTAETARTAVREAKSA